MNFMLGEIYWDGRPTKITRVISSNDEFIILFNGYSTEYRQDFSGRVVLNKTTEFQTSKGDIEYTDLTGKFSLDYALEGSFEDDSYEMFSGNWKEEGDIYQFEISLEPEVHELEVSKKDEQIIELANKIENSMIVDEQLDFSTQLSRFFSDWIEISSQKKEVVQQQLTFEQKLVLFFKKFRDLPSIEEVPEQPLFVDSMALENFFKDFNIAVEPIREARAQGLSANVWTAAGLGTKEVRNSPVLKWFLDGRGDHGQGNIILLMLLKLLPPRFHQYQPKNYSAIDECSPLGNLENRVDIEIDTSEFLLFIEVKIYANEGVDQLKRYYREAMLKTKNINKDWAIIYLTKTGCLSTNEQVIKDALLNDKDENTKLIHDNLRNDKKNRLIPVSWSAISKILYQYAKTSDVNNHSAWLAKQFADHIKTF